MFKNKDFEINETVGATAVMDEEQENTSVNEIVRDNCEDSSVSDTDNSTSIIKADDEKKRGLVDDPSTRLTIQLIKIDEIDHNPNNPRLILRRDNINHFTEEMKQTGCYDPAHAITVRKVGSRFVIIDGHHRFSAAMNAGLSHIWAFIKSYKDDDDAYFNMITANNQSELTQLEYGIAVCSMLGAVKKSAGGRGKKGGFRELSRKIGKNETYLKKASEGAKVYFEIKDHFPQKESLLEKCPYLAEISMQAQDLWLPMAKKIVDNASFRLSDLKSWIKGIQTIRQNLPNWWTIGNGEIAKSTEKCLGEVDHIVKTISNAKSIYESLKIVHVKIKNDAGEMVEIDFDQQEAFRKKLNAYNDFPTVKLMEEWKKEIKAYPKLPSQSEEEGQVEEQDKEQIDDEPKINKEDGKDESPDDHREDNPDKLDDQESLDEDKLIDNKQFPKTESDDIDSDKIDEIISTLNEITQELEKQKLNGISWEEKDLSGFLQNCEDFLSSIQEEE